MPDAVAACRVCLAVDVRLLPIAGSLQLVYERITNNTLHTADGRPVAACFICYAQLNKCLTLMRTSAWAENVLNAIVHRQSEITEKSISLVDREAVSLSGSLRYSRAEYYNTEVPIPVVIKTEPESDVANADIGYEEPEEGPPQPADMCGNKSDSDDEDPVSPSQPCDTEMDATEQGELVEGVASAQTSAADKRKQADGSTTNKKQRESRRESTTRTAQGPHQCDICQRWFTCASHMIIHYRTHTGEKPFQCNVCDYRFNQKSHLFQHLRTHTGEKPFKCDVCYHRFNQKSHLFQHLRTHTGEKPFKCDVCDRRFNRKSSLLIHLRTHTGEKPFQCNVCDRRFNHKGNLLTHIRTHTGEKPFQCEVCQHRFSHKSHLLYHLRTHNKKKQLQ